MNFKITARFISTVVLVTMLVILLNMGLGLAFIIDGLISDNRLEGGEKDFSPEIFTEEFSDRLLSRNGQIEISREGARLLDEEGAWIQILDEDAREVYSFKKPGKVKDYYNPRDLIHMYKYSLEDSMSTIFISQLDLGGETYSYIIGFPLERIKRNVLSYDINILSAKLKKGIYVVLGVDIIVSLVFGYIFSRKLTRPLIGIIDDIKSLAEGDYSIEREEKGLYKKIYKNINHLALKLRNSEEERRKLDRMKEEWISNISHDIKTPLSSIKGYAEVLSNGDYEIGSDEVVSYAEIIEDKSDYIKDLIDDLNLSTRLKNKDLVLKKERVNIVSLSRDIVIDILNNSSDARVNINFQAEREFIDLEGDRLLLRRALTNLIYNSIVHNKEGVDIDLIISKKEKIHIIIRDNGRGICQEDLGNIFQRHYRGTNTSKQDEGSGLGMVIAKDIIRAHDGKLRLRSKLGEGTEIEIIL